MKHYCLHVIYVPPAAKKNFNPKGGRIRENNWNHAEDRKFCDRNLKKHEEEKAAISVKLKE